MPPSEALRFRDFVQTRGEPITVVRLTEAGEDDYGNPVYAESSHTEKAFVEMDGRERDLPPGTVKIGSLRLFLVLWAAVQGDNHEVEIDGLRYHIVSLVKTRAYMQVEGERKAQ